MLEEKIYPVQILGTSILICHSKRGTRRYDTVMETISDKEYNLIAHRGYNYHSPKYGIIKDDVVFIGKLDFNNPSVITILEELKIADDYQGFKIYSGFNFETADIKTEDGKLKYYDTWNNIKIMQYKYCQINKPEYVIIFRGFAKN